MEKSSHSTTDSAAIFMNAWRGHERILHEKALTYLDSLMDQIVSEGPVDRETLIDKLHLVTPILNRGTVRRLVNLKFDHPDATIRLHPTPGTAA